MIISLSLSMCQISSDRDRQPYNWERGGGVILPVLFFFLFFFKLWRGGEDINLRQSPGGCKSTRYIHG